MASQKLLLNKWHLTQTEHLSKSRACSHKKLSFLKTLICIENKIDLRVTLQCIYSGVAVYMDLGSFFSL